MRIPKPCPSVRTREKKSPWLRQCQFYISNWYINRKVFTSTTPWKPKNLKIKKFEFWLVANGWNHHSFVNINPTSIIDTSMERSSRVLGTSWKPRNLIFRCSNGNKITFSSKVAEKNFLKLTIGSQPITEGKSSIFWYCVGFSYWLSLTLSALVRWIEW